MKWLFFFLLLSDNLHALPWESDMHHLGPLLEVSQESNVKLQEAYLCLDETNPSPIKYISDRPKTEAWRKYYNMPKLMTEDFYKVQDICQEAKKMNKAQGVEKPYALMAHKTHFCDTNHMACICTLKSISDPCNYFVQDNFQVFHARSFVGSFKPSGSKEITDTYGNLGPSLFVIDLKTCTLLPTQAAAKVMKTGMSEKQALKENYFYTAPSVANGKDEKGKHLFKSDDEHTRFEAMKESLLGNLPDLKNLSQKRVSCFEKGQRTLPGIKDQEEVQYGDMKIKGILGIRKLMDEQLIQETGQNPY